MLFHDKYMIVCCEKLWALLISFLTSTLRTQRQNVIQNHKKLQNMSLSINLYMFRKILQHPASSTLQKSKQRLVDHPTTNLGK